MSVNSVSQDNFESAKDKVLMGSERRSMVLSDEEKKNTAYHEAGHALVARMLPGTDPVHKVTIIPRGMALGLTQQLPEEDRHSYNRTYLSNTLAILYGGRVAEELVLKEITTGAGNDIERATQLAQKMICEWGMSDALGPVMLKKPSDEPFLGMDLHHQREYSEDTARQVDMEVKALLTGAYRRAEAILTANIDTLHRMAGALLERETLDSGELDEILASTGASLPAGA